MNFKENIDESWRAIKASYLRAILTVLVIAFGLTALIGVLTAIDGIKFWFANSFTRLGTNTFRIENLASNIRMGGRVTKEEMRPPITFIEAETFKKELGRDNKISLVSAGNFASVVKYKNRTTQNNLQLMGGDENYIYTANYEIDKGRNLNPSDLDYFRNVIILGKEAENELFPYTDPIGKLVQVNGKNYMVAGTFAKVGSAGFMGGDKICVIPVTTLQKDFPKNDRSYGLHVYTENLETMDDVIVEAVGHLRRIRGIRPREPNNFAVVKTQSFIESLMENLRFLTLSATAIALITLFSASIGLMNIMLVSVTERTREIGIRKALGATRGNILSQFLTEAIMICQLGGFIGILMGTLFGNLIGLLLGNKFLLPWNWLLGGMALTFVVGLLSGIYPARKAASLDPIEALRHE